MGRMSQAKALKLCADVGESRDSELARRIRAHSERARARWTGRTAKRTRLAEAHLPLVLPERLTVAEQQFVVHAAGKGKAFRGGWPDFLLEREGQKPIGIEVKKGGDQLRPAQVKMLAALERAGIDSFVWDPRRPDRLVPWRKYAGPRSVGN